MTERMSATDSKKRSQAVLKLLADYGPLTKQDIGEFLDISNTGQLLGSLMRYGHIAKDAEGRYAIREHHSWPENKPQGECRPTIKQIRESLDWLFNYVSQLEEENQSLYNALSTYGNQSNRIRERYEDRLQALISVKRDTKSA